LVNHPEYITETNLKYELIFGVYPNTHHDKGLYQHVELKRRK